MKDEFYIYSILRSKNTVFTASELAMIWQETNMKNLYERLRYYRKSGKLIQIKRGFYAVDENYSRFEFANKLYKPSYLSLNTILRREGIIFQYYETIYLCSYISRDIKVADTNYRYKKLSSDILFNPKGVFEEDFYLRASKERAFLDAIYLYKDYYFDNLRPLDWDICFDLVEIYSSKAMQTRLESYYKIYKDKWEQE